VFESSGYLGVLCLGLRLRISISLLLPIGWLPARLPPRRRVSEDPVEVKGGPCIAKVVDDAAEGVTRECGRCVSSCWYGKGKLYCASHRTAWNKSKAQADDAEEPSYLDDMTEIIGTRYCEPSKMKLAEKYNSIKKTSLCVQGTFIPEGYERGTTDARWQTVDELVAAISREDFKNQSSEYIKELQKSFKRDAKRFRTAAQLATECALFLYTNV
jgi:hypothetical protein